MTSPTNKLDVGAMMTRKPLIDSPDILVRIEGAKDRLRDGHALMRIPVDPTDPDCVLADAELEIKRLRALLSASKPATPEGWKLVPVEPSEEMIQAACIKQSNTAFESYEKWLDSHSGGISVRIRQLVVGDYRVMLAASPAAPAQTQAVRVDEVRAETAENRLIAAIEGECNGLAITDDQASNILAYLQYGAPMGDVIRDAERYRKLRDADINAIRKGGVFAGITPDNVVINGDDLDIAVDLLLPNMGETEF